MVLVEMMLLPARLSMRVCDFMQMSTLFELHVKIPLPLGGCELFQGPASQAVRRKDPKADITVSEPFSRFSELLRQSFQYRSYSERETMAGGSRDRAS